MARQIKNWKDDYFVSKIRNKLIKKYNNECFYCKSKENLVIHHKEYGIFDMNNLILVCSKCHKRVHGITKNFDKNYNKLQIQVTKQTRKELQRLKLTQRESYEEILRRLIEICKSQQK